MQTRAAGACVSGSIQLRYALKKESESDLTFVTRPSQKALSINSVSFEGSDDVDYCGVAAGGMRATMRRRGKSSRALRTVSEDRLRTWSSL